MFKIQISKSKKKFVDHQTAETLPLARGIFDCMALVRGEKARIINDNGKTIARKVSNLGVKHKSKQITAVNTDTAQEVA